MLTLNSKSIGQDEVELLFNHCRGYMGMIQSRHGEILKRIRKAIPSDLGDIYLEQEIPGDPERNRPDLVAINSSQEKAIVVDVTIPFKGE